LLIDGNAVIGSVEKQIVSRVSDEATAFSIVEKALQKVKRWHSVGQIERWVGSALLVAERRGLKASIGVPAFDCFW